MNKYEIVKKIESFAPPELAEKWDCSGWIVETDIKNVSKIMLCLTVTDIVVKQAKEHNCDMIISHHPLFCVPLAWKNIDIYCAHTNLDKAQGGTTDTLVNTIFPRPLRPAKPVHMSADFCAIFPLPLREGEELLNKQSEFSNSGEGFVRYIEQEISISDFLLKLKKISPNLRYVNNEDVNMLKKIAFCAGSGSEFIQEAYENGADAFVTGDLKFHTALESPIVLFDIGHFESEILVLPVFERIIGTDVDFIYAEEKSPFLHK